jgi:hypothetical protein
MTTATVEQRLEALEQTVAELKAQFTRQSAEPPPGAGNPGPEEETLLPEVEYPLIVKVPPKARFRIQATIGSIKKGRRDLGLSDADWESLGLEADHE